MQLNNNLYEQLGRKISDKAQDTYERMYAKTARDCADDIVETLDDIDDLTASELEDIFGGVLSQTPYVVTFNGPFEALSYSGHAAEVLHEKQGLGEYDNLEDAITDAAYEALKRDVKQHIVNFRDIDAEHKKLFNDI